MLFLLFAAYGPSFTFLGQLRIVEVALLGIAFVGVQQLVKLPSKLEWRFIWYFVLTSVVYVYAGYWFDSTFASITLRAGTYFLFALLLPTIAMLSKYEPTRLLAIILGYSASYVTSYFLADYVPNFETYALVPWRLGLGYAFTWAVLCIFVVKPHLLRLAPVVLIGLTVVHIVMGSRSIAFFTMLAAVLVFISLRSRKTVPPPFSWVQVMIVGIAMLALGYGLLRFMVMLAEIGYLPEEMTWRMLSQYYSTHGIFAAVRAPNYVAAYGMLQSPLLGYGPGNSDPELSLLYTELIADFIGTSENLQTVFNHYLEQKWGSAIPAHSHIQSAWIEAGIIPGLSWVFVFALCVYVLVRSLKFVNPWMPMYVFVCGTTMWDLVFSPGPHRVDIAVRMVLLFFAVRQFSQIEKQARQQPQFDPAQAAPRTRYKIPARR